MITRNSLYFLAVLLEDPNYHSNQNIATIQ